MLLLCIDLIGSISLRTSSIGFNNESSVKRASLILSNMKSESSEMLFNAYTILDCEKS